MKIKRGYKDRVIWKKEKLMTSTITEEWTIVLKPVKTMYFLKVDKVCDTEDVEQQSITFEKECKEVTSKVCGPAAAVHPYGIIKREAEAEAEVRTPSRIVENPTFYQPIPQRFRIYLCEIHGPLRTLCSFDGYH